MKKEAFIIVSLLIVTSSSLSSVNKTQIVIHEYDDDREGKVISLVRIRIPGPICQSGLDPMNQGYCDGIVSCLSYFGKITGLCPGTIGVCCVVTRSCGKRIPNRVAYFTSGGPVRTIENIFNQAIAAKPQGIFSNIVANKPCNVTVVRFNSDVTQLRLDFISFDLAQPTAAGDCLAETFVVTGNLPTDAAPTLCGINTGNHIYVRFNAAGGPITLSATLAANSASSFVIKITQIIPTEGNAAPAGCLQYFPTATGTVESFNFNGNQLLRFTYTFCVPDPARRTWDADVFVVGVAGDPTCQTSDFLNFISRTINITTGMAISNNRVCVTFPADGILANNRVTFTTYPIVPTPDGRFRLTYK